MIRPHSWACSSLFHSIYLWTSTINKRKKWWILNQIQSINFQAQNNKFNGQHMQQNSRSFIWCARVCVCVRLSWLKILFFLLLSKAEKSSSMGVANVLDFLDLSLSLSCSHTHILKTIKLRIRFSFSNKNRGTHETKCILSVTAKCIQSNKTYFFWSGVWLSVERTLWRWRKRTSPNLLSLTHYSNISRKTRALSRTSNSFFTWNKK